MRRLLHREAALTREGCRISIVQYFHKAILRED